MPATQQSVTSLPRSPQEDRHARMVKYTIAMTIRMVCILSCLFLQGWWLAVAAVGAVVLPYFAVILANVGGNQGTAVERPGGVVVVSARHSGFPPPAEPYAPAEPFPATDPRMSSEPFTMPESFTTYETGRGPDAARPADARPRTPDEAPSPGSPEAA
ncbi:DUF3099 domain-containing protein [Clavibacter michiganensis]|uniref:DUF3099 domain-containing protein n=1 Tax=Clavibacter michiganensis TaxID=28447 RepID=UPI000689E7D8|nr:DUF3099 domain-containing protein [Clavibacter michiganensis]